MVSLLAAVRSVGLTKLKKEGDIDLLLGFG